MVIYWTIESKIADLLATTTLDPDLFSINYNLVFTHLIISHETLIKKCDKKFILLLD